MRKHESKPGIDWVVIEARVKQGEALAAIARDYNISRQAIQKRSKRDGWLSVNEAVKDARRVARKVTGLPMSVAVQPAQPVQPVAGVQPDGRVQPSVTKPAINVGVQKFNKDTPEVRASILSLISEGVPKTIAAECSGVNIDTLTRWINDDQEFGIEVRAQERRAVADRVQRIGAAGKRGDWKADSWYLERTQREIFGSDSHKGGGVAVQINIMRDGDPEVIDVTPAE